MLDQRKAVRRAYDEMAEVYAADRSTETNRLDAFIDRLSGESRILDAGCGQGEPVATRLSRQFEVVGMDFSREQLRLAQANAPSIALTQGDMTTLGFATDSFDGICAYYSIIHVPIEQHPVVMSEFARVLRSGGPLLITVGEASWTGSNPDWLDSGVEMQWSYPDIEEAHEYLSDVGFELIRQWIDEDDHPLILAQLR